MKALKGKRIGCPYSRQFQAVTGDELVLISEVTFKKRLFWLDTRWAYDASHQTFQIHLFLYIIPIMQTIEQSNDHVADCVGINHYHLLTE